MHRPALALLLALSAPLQAAPGDPLVPGPRWVHPAPAATPWIPDSIAFAGQGDLVLASARGGSPRLLSLDGAASAWPAARAVELAVGGGQGSMDLLGTSDPRRAFALLQPLTATPGVRRTEVRAVDPAADLAALWSYDVGFASPSLARLVADETGAILVVAVHAPHTGKVQLDWLDGASGVRIARTWVDGANVAALSLSADARRAALLAGDRLYLFGPSGQLLQTIPLAAPARAIDLDADGDTLLVGGQHQVAVLREGANGYAVSTSLYPGAPHWFAMVAAVAPAGDALAIGWWDTQSGRAVRYELWETAPQQLIWSTMQVSSVLQHLPSAAVFSADGRRAAFGGWGAPNEPEVLWVDRATGANLLTIDLPGSVQALALDERGERLAVAHKDAHAAVAATTGAVRLFASGEAELELLAAPSSGGSLQLAARHPDQGFVFFLLGRADEPHLLGSIGTLWLDRSSLSVHARPTDAQGRADLEFALPLDAGLVGTRLGAQAAFRGLHGLSLGATLLEPLVLD